MTADTASRDLGDELLGRAAAFADGTAEPATPADTNPMGLGGAEVGDGVALVTSFSHVVALAGDGGLTLVDTSARLLAGPVLQALRRWSGAPVTTVVYTHGHVDHVGGAEAVLAEAAAAGRPRPQVVAHQAVADRFRRYQLTDGYNAVVNARQFRPGRRGGAAMVGGGTGTGTPAGGGSAPAGRPGGFALDWVWPDVTFTDRLQLPAGGERGVLHHDKGETDDHAWLWLPERRAVCSGDFLTWTFPNAGNPQKVQRYPLEWARALRAMAGLEPELLLPAHGLPLAGRDRIARVLGDVAGALEGLVADTLELMNAGATLDDVLHTVRLPDDLAARPYLRATYDEPEFVVRGIWRRYGGWWDGDPASLKPAPAAALATELADLAGGAGRLADRAASLSAAGDHRLACHLAELAARAAPGDPAVHAVRADVYRARRRAETSLMARSIYAEAVDASEAVSPLPGAGPSAGTRWP